MDLFAPGIAMFSLYVVYTIIASDVVSFYDWDGLGAKLGSGCNYVSSCLTTTPSTRSLKTTSSGWCSNTAWRFRRDFRGGLFLTRNRHRQCRIYKCAVLLSFVISRSSSASSSPGSTHPISALFYNLIEWFTAPASPVLADDRYVSLRHHRCGLCRRLPIA